MKNIKWIIASIVLLSGSVFFAQRLWLQQNNVSSTSQISIDEETDATVNMDSLVAIDLEHIKNAYAKNKTIKYNLKYILKKERVNDSAIMDGTMTIRAGDFYGKIGNMEYVQQDGKFLYIDHEYKLVSLFLKDKIAHKKIVVGDLAPLLKHITAVANEIFLETVSPHSKKITMSLLDNRIDSLKITYNANSYLIEQSETQLNSTKEEDSDSYFMTTIFSNYQISKDKLPFQLKQFLTKENKKGYSLRNILKGYQLQIIDK